MGRSRCGVSDVLIAAVAAARSFAAGICMAQLRHHPAALRCPTPLEPSSVFFTACMHAAVQQSTPCRSQINHHPRDYHRLTATLHYPSSSASRCLRSLLNAATLPSSLQNNGRDPVTKPIAPFRVLASYRPCRLAVVASGCPFAILCKILGKGTHGLDPSSVSPKPLLHRVAWPRSLPYAGQHPLHDLMALSISTPTFSCAAS